MLELHPYELPEFLVCAVTDGSAGYLDWVRSETIAAIGPGVRLDDRRRAT